MGIVIGLAFGCGVALVLAGPSRVARVKREGKLHALVRESGIPRLTVPGLILAMTMIFLGSAFLVLAVTTVPVVALLAGICAAAIPVVVVRRRRSRRQILLQQAWPDAVETLVSAVRAGMSLPEGLASLASHGPEPLRESFAVFASEYRSSGSLAASLNALQETLADPVADRVVASMRIAREVGGNDLGTVLRTLADFLREDARTRAEIAARQSWTVNAARLAAAAPWVTLLMLSTRPEAAAAYASVPGAIVICICAALTFIAYRLMMTIGRLPREGRVIR